MSRISINGRFLTQPLTGVQRVGSELLRALDALAGEGRAPPITILAPPGATAPWLRSIELRVVGSIGGQAWEQGALASAARGSLLINPANTAPLLAGRDQLVVIHDAGAFDTPESYNVLFRSWYRLLHRALARRGVRIATVSQFSRARLAHWLRRDPMSIAVIPEGAEHILREPADGTILDRHGLRPHGYVLAVGTGAAHKNLGLLTVAASWLGGRGLTFAMAGARDPAVFAADGALPGAVALGRVSDRELRALYAGALCLVFPSRYEGFGLPPLEAMACGCPVLAARAASVPEVCGNAALWFDPALPESLITALTQLCDEPGLADRLRHDGLERARAFTWRGAAASLLAQIAPACAAAIT